MGIKGLYTYLRGYRKNIEPFQVSPKRIGVDALSLLYKYKGDTKEILSLLKGLHEAGHKILLVFDGKPPPEKGPEIQTRKDLKMGAAGQAMLIQDFLNTTDATSLDIKARKFLEQSLSRCTTQSWYVTRDMRRAFQDNLWDAGVPYVKSISEADDVLVDLYKGGKLDVILSTDMDYLAAGVECLWTPSKLGQFEEILLSQLMQGEGVDYEQFVDVCILCRNVTCEQAFTWMRHYKSMDAIMDSSLKGMHRLEYSLDMERMKFSHKEAYSRIRPDHLERVRNFLDAL